jgi:hypothetical protein
MKRQGRGPRVEGSGNREQEKERSFVGCFDGIDVEKDRKAIL